jgi:pSer/pThr/pTyr-binding forkhead associated (FHA) protein
MSTRQVVLTVLNGDLRGRAYVFEKPMRCVIGRSRDCEISLASTADFAGISRHHCALEINPPQASVSDLGSLNGTFVNDERVGGRKAELMPGHTSDYDHTCLELRNDDVLRVGDIHFRVSIIEPAFVESPGQQTPVASA